MHLPRDAEHLSPNQTAKRDAIVNAAVEVLVHDGVHRCTVRSIAAAAGVSKGVVHYYFTDVEEIVDAAMAVAIGAWVVLVRDGVPEAAGPAETLWRVVDACLQPFVDGDVTVMPLWLEYWASCTRAQRLEPLRAVYGQLTALVRDLLDRVGVADPEGRARAVTAYLLGTGMQDAILPAGRDQVRSVVAAICGVPAPA